jgi:hypothetical protein
MDRESELSMRSFFRKHPKIHSLIHWLSFALGGVMMSQDKILGASALFPADSVVPRYIAYGLGVVAFSTILIGKAEAATADPAAPTSAISASEAITKVEKSDPEKSK